MNAPQLENKKGFTIIEVVLVLAIAALIFLMVFIALPALQRNQRDTARKNQMSKVLSAVTSYQSNNRGKNPVIGDSFAKYLDGDYEAAGSLIRLGTDYTVKIDTPTSGNVPSSADNDNIALVYGFKCDVDGKVVTGGSNRQAAVVMKLENGDAFYCQEG